MAALQDYLGLTVAAAQQQWRRIRNRPPPAKGRRQGTYEPLEVLLCIGLFHILDPHRYGGANIHTLPSGALALAVAFRRSPGSITSKMLNLDGSRQNSGKAEVELFAYLSGAPAAYPDLYKRIMTAARREGLGPSEVPDFLGWTEAPVEGLVGQDEIGHGEIELALKEQAANQKYWQGQGLRPFQTSRIVERRVRLGQHRFAREVLERFDHRCGFCGFAPASIGMKRALVASHIKPWRDSGARERLDPNNGVAACSIHDVAFDQGFLTINGGLRVHRADPLGQLIVRDGAADYLFGPGTVASRLLLPDGSSGPSARYLRWHHQHVWTGRALH